MIKLPLYQLLMYTLHLINLQIIFMNSIECLDHVNLFILMMGYLLEELELMNLFLNLLLLFNDLLVFLIHRLKIARLIDLWLLTSRPFDLQPSKQDLWFYYCISSRISPC